MCCTILWVVFAHGVSNHLRFIMGLTQLIGTGPSLCACKLALRSWSCSTSCEESLLTRDGDSDQLCVCAQEEQGSTTQRDGERHYISVSYQLRIGVRDLMNTPCFAGYVGDLIRLSIYVYQRPILAMIPTVSDQSVTPTCIQVQKYQWRSVRDQRARPPTAKGLPDLHRN